MQAFLTLYAGKHWHTTQIISWQQEAHAFTRWLCTLLKLSKWYIRCICVWLEMHTCLQCSSFKHLCPKP
jgi:hypothetical protein